MADPVDNANIVFLANWDGTDGDTSYSAEAGGAVTFNNSAELDDGVQLFTKTTVLCDQATTDYLTWGTQPELQFLHDRSVDYTIEGWFRVTDLSHSNTILGTKDTGAGVTLSVISGGYIRYLVQKTGGSIIGDALSAAGAIVADTWYYFKVIHDDSAGSIKLRLDGAVAATDASLSSIGVTIDNNAGLVMGAGGSLYAPSTFDGNLGPIRITKNEALDDSDVPVAPFAGGTVTNEAVASVGCAFGSPSVVALNDFSNLITDTSSYYVMEISGDPILRIKISSWQATMQLDQAPYLQCVIPAADDYYSEITPRRGSSTMSVYRVTQINGVEQRNQIASAPFSTSAYAKGPNNTTVTISGYSAMMDEPQNPATRAMTGLRSIATYSSGLTRLRCDIDWFLQPGDTATFDGQSISARYINYFVPTTGDAYMDIGDR